MRNIRIRGITTIFLFLFYQGIYANTNQPKPRRTSTIRFYNYTSESIGASGLSILTSKDSVYKRTPFLKRPDIQVLQSFVSCKIKKTTVGETGKEKTCVLEIIQPVIRVIKDKVDYPLSPDLKEELSRPVFFKMGERGNITGVKLISKISDIGKNIINDILGDFQFVKSDTSNIKWGAEEESSIGVYNSSYQISEGDKDRFRFRKTNSGFISFLGQHKGSRIEPKQETDIWLDTTQEIKKITHSFSYVIITEGDTVVASGNKKEFLFISEYAPKKDSIEFFRSLEKTPGYGPYFNLSRGMSDEEILRRTYQSALGEENFETLTRQLNNADKLSEDARFELVKKLRALAFLSPSVCEKIGSLLVMAKRETNRYDILLHALYSTETESSATALAHAIRKNLSDKAFCLDLLPYLTISKKTSQEAAYILKKILENNSGSPELNTTIELSLGGMSMHARKNNQLILSDFIYSFLINRFKNSSDTIQKLMVIGNAGAPQSIPLIKQYLYTIECSLDVKENAIDALRFIEDSEVDDILQKSSLSPELRIAEKAKSVIEWRKSSLNND